MQRIFQAKPTTNSDPNIHVHWWDHQVCDPPLGIHEDFATFPCKSNESTLTMTVYISVMVSVSYAVVKKGGATITLVVLRGRALELSTSIISRPAWRHGTENKRQFKDT